MEQTKAEFIDYLESTLIPDLFESGRGATAQDFQAAIEFIKGAESVEIPFDEQHVDAFGEDSQIREAARGGKLFFLASPESPDYIEVGSSSKVTDKDTDMEDENGTPLPVGSVVLFPH